MTIHRRLAANLGVIVVLAMVMIAWAMSRLILANGFSSPFTVTADMAASGGVFTGQEVTYRGVLVGRIGTLELNEDGVDIELVIDAEWAGKIPEDVIASVQSKSAVGEQFVNLTPLDPDDDDRLADGDTIPRARTRLPVDFQELLSSLDKVLGDLPPEQTARVINNLSDGLDNGADDIGAILDSLGTLADAFADVAPESKHLLNTAPRAGRAFLDSKEAFASAIAAADRVLAGIGDEPEELQAFFAANDAFARDFIALLARHGRNLESGIEGLADLVSFQLQNADAVKDSLRYIPGFLHAVEDASIPWRSPDGRKFYRIRVGLVVDNVPSSWPCKYRLPAGYERFPHERKARDPRTDLRCLPPSEDDDAAVRSLVSALMTWAAEDPAEIWDPTAAESGAVPELIWPLFGEITSGFGPREGGMHTGIDIDGTTGEPVAAAAGGKVVLAGTYFGYGNTVVIDHGDGVTTLYGHLSTMAVAEGDVIERGERIGTVGCSGDCSGDHLHLELLLGETPVDPLPYLPGGPLFGPGAGRAPVP